MIRFDQPIRTFALCLAIVILTISAAAQTYTELLSLNGNTAAGPTTSLVQGIDGKFYGTTYYGGTGTCFDNQGIGCGVVFKISQTKGLEIIYNFQKSGPVYPGNNLLLGSDGNFYGTTVSGNGSVFKITPAGSLTVLHEFGSSLNGDGLRGGLIQGLDGNFYGTTLFGGTPSQFCPEGCGTVFKMTSAGGLTTLYSFCPQNYCPDGENPSGSLAQGLDGNFYGTTLDGGLYKTGTIFKITPKGAFNLLYTFSTFQPYPGGLVLASDGNFYGEGQNELYRVTPQGDLTVLPNNSGYLQNPPTQGTDGNLYWTISRGGNLGQGGISTMTLEGTSYSLVYTFNGYPDDGSYPVGSLVQATDGKFYGVTYSGGSSPCNYGTLPGCGTIFSLDMGLGPFVTLVRPAGKVGGTGGILGQGFTGTTAVTVNGTPASFIVKSDTLILATVPAGATTGYVTVTTPSGTLTSNVPFHVIQ